ncbi:hypothetical protein CH63R_14481 [Colletotrichum higginsianum IMI 349063]|uniref:Uncharacterized protein n=1 Tax=Colletotrichum higginsianum (strain IMI 349063) TaxID=759273 RepID=A0A1B7XQZ0_COLHI|nr:hypothetical protein CH63R_14481 [Colletotrichum higginsianum IMI 349063]OBR02180.1 hypothetical protein CH63R_14481 [Colletotrichum higginsianum IMI 349063]
MITSEKRQEGREKGAKQRKQRKSQGRENDAIDEGRARSRLEPQFEVIEDPADREITVRFDTLYDPFETPFETPSRAPRSRTSLPSQRRQNTTAPLPLEPHEANIHFSIEPRFLGVASVPIVRPFQVVWRLKTSLAGNIIAMRWDKQLLKETRDRIRSHLQGQYHLTKRWISIEFGEKKATAKTSVTYFRNDFSAVDGK